MLKAHECGICGRTFPKSGKLNQHMRIHTGEKPYHCTFPSCDKRYSRRDHLNRHQQSHTPDVAKKYKCTFDGCTKSFVTKQKLERHTAVHTKAKQFTCTECDETFAKKWILAQHKAAAHGEGDKSTPYKCNEPGCDKRFLRPSGLQRHMNKVHNWEGKEYICGDTKCNGIAFKKMSELKRHMSIVHPRVKQWECPECALCLRNKTRLDKHIKTHRMNVADRLEYFCEVPGCMKAYTTKSNLNAHVRSFHDKIKVECQDCSATFAHKQSLQRHQLVCEAVLGKRQVEKQCYESDLENNTYQKKRKVYKADEDSSDTGNNIDGQHYDFFTSLCGEVPAVSS